jgi:hypothetical protein
MRSPERREVGLQFADAMLDGPDLRCQLIS